MASNTTLFSIPPPTKINDTHKVYSIAVACIVLGVFASLTVILRLIQRVRSRAFGLDDYAIIPGLVILPHLACQHQLKGVHLAKNNSTLAVLHWMDDHGRLCQSPCRGRKTPLGNHTGRVLCLVQGMASSSDQQLRLSADTAIGNHW